MLLAPEGGYQDTPEICMQWGNLVPPHGVSWYCDLHARYTLNSHTGYEIEY